MSDTDTIVLSAMARPNGEELRFVLSPHPTNGALLFHARVYYPDGRGNMLPGKGVAMAAHRIHEFYAHVAGAVTALQAAGLAERPEE